MIAERDLDEAIAECQGKRNPVADDCVKLAAFYTIKEHLYPAGAPRDTMKARAFASPPTGLVECPDGGEFGRMVDGRAQSEVWPVIVELMETLAVMNPRLYGAVMRKLQ